MRRATTGLLVLGLLAGSPAVGRGAEPSAAPARLAGTTVVVGAETAYTTVRLDRPARIDVRMRMGRATGPNPTVVFSGGGSAAAVALTSLEPSAESDPLFIAGRFRSCHDEHCPGGDWVSYSYPSAGGFHFSTSGETRTQPRYLELDPGTYRLYLIGGGAPARAVLRLEGLDGRTTLTPTQDPAGFDAHAPEGSIDSTPAGNVFRGGAAYEAGQHGFFVSFLNARLAPEASAEWGICEYGGPTAPPDDVAYGPHCSNPAWGAGFSGSFTDAGGSRLVAVFLGGFSESSLPPNLDGRRGIGGWVSSPASIEAASTGAFSITF